MTRRSTLVMVVGLLIGVALSAPLPVRSAGTPLSPAEVANRLQEKYDQTGSMTADFEQRSSMHMSDRIRMAKGKVAIVKPGKIRWDYQEPDRQILLGDGKNFLMYFEKTRQMVVRSLTEYIENDVTYSFFAGSGNVGRDFDVQGQPGGAADVPVSALLPDAENRYGLKLTPRKPHPQVDFLNVWVDAASFLVVRLQIVDLFGNTTDLTFSGIQVNPQLPEAHFSFVPPAGTEIIEQF